MIKLLLSWMFKRVLGCRDFGKWVHYMLLKDNRTTWSSDFWGCLFVTNDEIIDRYVEYTTDSDGTPIRYETNVFLGTEDQPGKEPEYWVGVKRMFYSPIIPVSVIMNEKVYKLGTGCTALVNAMAKSGHAYDLFEHESEFTHKIINNANTVFDKSNVYYDNDEVWATYD